MAGLAVRAMSWAIAIPVQKFIVDKLEDGWRASTGTEPPSLQRRKQQVEDNQKAEELGLLPRPVDEPKLADSLMWAALSAMSIIAVKYIAERGAEEAYRWVAGKTPPREARTALARASSVGKREGTKGSHNISAASHRS